MTKRISIKAGIIGDGQNRPNRVKSLVPKAIRDYLGGRKGDELVYEEGTAWSEDDARKVGRYVILRLGKKAVAKAEASQETTERAPAVQLEPLAEAVRKKRDERGMPAR
jgi:bifunctional DNA-binding transcriptional regulator/antitoxin component of YhaV-PrlF toxin-antitoxin module